MASLVGVRSVGSAATVTGSSPISVPYPATISAGDLLVAFIGGACVTSFAVTAPTDWAILANIDGDLEGTYDPGASVLYKWATGSESGSLSFTLTGSPNSIHGYMVAFSSVHSTDPFDTSNYNAAQVGSGTNPATTTGLTANTDYGMHVLGAWTEDDVTCSFDSGTSMWSATSTIGGDSSSNGRYKDASTASATTYTVTQGTNGPDGLAYIEFILRAATVNASLTQTLADATISSTGTVLIQATSAQTLADLALSATGTVLIQSALSQALEDVGISATAINTIAGTVTQTLEDAAIVATGEVKDRTIIDGTLSVTLDDVSISAYGTLDIQATVTVTLDDVQIVSTIFKWHWIDPDSDDTWTLAADSDDSWSDQADTNDSWADQLDNDDTWTNDSSEATTWH